MENDLRKNTKCADAKAPTDPTCHSMLYAYDTKIDVKNFTGYTLKNLGAGEKYYFAATAYDTDDNEFAFSEELTHNFDFMAPENPTRKSYDVKRSSRIFMG